MNNIARPDYQQAIFQTRQKLDSYKKMWHTQICQPSLSELKTEVSNSCMLINVGVFEISNTFDDQNLF